MDKTIFVEYADERKEIKDLRRRIDRNKRELERLNEITLADYATCGKKGKKPLKIVEVQASPVNAIKRKEKAIKKDIALLQEKEAELLERQTQVEEYIQNINKSELRIMFRLYFIDDLSYKKVAMNMNKMHPKREIKYTDENVKKKIQRFFQNVPQCPDAM